MSYCLSQCSTLLRKLLQRRYVKSMVDGNFWPSVMAHALVFNSLLNRFSLVEIDDRQKSGGEAY